MYLSFSANYVSLLNDFVKCLLVLCNKAREDVEFSCGELWTGELRESSG